MRSLLERTDRIDGDFVLAGHAVKQLLGTFQCACAQHLGQIVGGLIQVGKAHDELSDRRCFPLDHAR